MSDVTVSVEAVEEVRPVELSADLLEKVSSVRKRPGHLAGPARLLTSRLLVECCLADAIDARAHSYWSALDNFEWILGQQPAVGLVAVDRATQRCEVKDCARYLGGIARRNAPA